MRPRISIENLAPLLNVSFVRMWLSFIHSIVCLFACICVHHTLYFPLHWLIIISIRIKFELWFKPQNLISDHSSEATWKPLFAQRLIWEINSSEKNTHTNHQPLSDLDGSLEISTPSNVQKQFAHKHADANEHYFLFYYQFEYLIGRNLIWFFLLVLRWK